jgi:hypothetical protein
VLELYQPPRGFENFNQIRELAQLNAQNLVVRAHFSSADEKGVNVCPQATFPDPQDQNPE